MTTYLVCECGHGVELHKKTGECQAPRKGTEGCFFNGEPIKCGCESWKPHKSAFPPIKATKATALERTLRGAVQVKRVNS